MARWLRGADQGSPAPLAGAPGPAGSRVGVGARTPGPRPAGGEDVPGGVAPARAASRWARRQRGAVTTDQRRSRPGTAEVTATGSDTLIAARRWVRCAGRPGRPGRGWRRRRPGSRSRWHAAAPGRPPSSPGSASAGPGRRPTPVTSVIPIRHGRTSRCRAASRRPTPRRAPCGGCAGWSPTSRHHRASVARRPVFELIQYLSWTDLVHAVPLLVAPGRASRGGRNTAGTQPAFVRPGPPRDPLGARTRPRTGHPSSEMITEAQAASPTRATARR
jgi:hypothetical protein